MEHYLDHSATTQVLPQAIEMAVQVMREQYGNPSSQHRKGLEAAAVLKQARVQTAQAMGAQPEEITFTAGGTESTNIALFGVAQKNRHHGGHIISTMLEHAATRNTLKQLAAQGFTVTNLQPDSSGHISLEAFADALQENTILVSCMLVNNEVGSMLPAEQMGKLLKARCPKAYFHIDAVQALFRVPLLPQKWQCDFMSVSGHKIGAPKGVGALYIKRGVRIPPLLFGGGQENQMRPGTEPLPNIAAFGEACRVRAQTCQEDMMHVTALSEMLRQRLHALPYAAQNGQNDVPHVLNFSFDGCKSEVMLRLLESEEVYVSAGSACSRGHESPVLTAMGLPKARVDTALRFSFAPSNTQEDVEACIAAIEKGAARLRR